MVEVARFRNELKNLSMELEDIEDEERKLQKLYPAAKTGDIVDVHHLGYWWSLFYGILALSPLRNVDIARRITHSSQRTRCTCS